MHKSKFYSITKSFGSFQEILEEVKDSEDFSGVKMKGKLPETFSAQSYWESWNVGTERAIAYGVNKDGIIGRLNTDESGHTADFDKEGSSPSYSGCTTFALIEPHVIKLKLVFVLASNNLIGFEPWVYLNMYAV